MGMKKWRLILFPFAVVYGVLLFLRNKCFDWSILKSQKLQIPSIGVGNLAVGGTGKSILIDYLLTNFKLQTKTAVLSRGYGRKTSGVLIADKLSTAATIGDEPYQFYKKHKEATIAVAEKRNIGVAKLLKEQPEIEFLLFDDLFQHRSTLPSLLVLTTTYERPYFRDLLLPMGSLREGKSAARRADIVVVTKCPKTLTSKEMAKFQKALHLNAKQRVFFTKLHYSNTIHNEKEKRALSSLKLPFVLVTGIADSSPLVAFLKGAGFQFKHMSYQDHHYFSLSDLKKIKYHQKEGLVLTTEKDFTRLQLSGEIERLFYLPVVLEFFEAESEKRFMQQVSQCLIKD
jgi:tetraacyldisaccharide 4'-kinase